jgi:hypothetical protein
MVGCACKAVPQIQTNKQILHEASVTTRKGVDTYLQHKQTNKHPADTCRGFETELLKLVISLDRQTNHQQAA